MARFIVSNDYWKSKDEEWTLQRTIYKDRKSGPHNTDIVFTKRGKDGKIIRIDQEEFFEICGEPTKLDTVTFEEAELPKDVLHKVRNLVKEGYDDFGRLTRKDLVALLSLVSFDKETVVRDPKAKVYLLEDAGDSPGKVLKCCLTPERARTEQLKTNVRYTKISVHQLLR